MTGNILTYTNRTVRPFTRRKMPQFVQGCMTQYVYVYVFINDLQCNKTSARQNLPALVTRSTWSWAKYTCYMYTIIYTSLSVCGFIQFGMKTSILEPYRSWNQLEPSLEYFTRNSLIIYSPVPTWIRHVRGNISQAFPWRILY